MKYKVRIDVERDYVIDAEVLAQMFPSERSDFANDQQGEMEFIEDAINNGLDNFNPAVVDFEECWPFGPDITPLP